MIPRSRETLGKLLILVGLGSIVLFTGLTGLLAPPVTQTDTTDGVDRGRTLVGVQGNPDGRVIMANASGGVVWAHDTAHGYHDVSQLANGSVLTGTITGGQTECGPYEAPCFHTGFSIINRSVSGATETVFNWTYPVRSGQNSEVHDVEQLPSGNYVVAGMEYERIFIVTQQGDIAWQWNASQHYDAPTDPTTTDWLHINDVDRIRNGTFLVSVRNKNQLLVIERGQGVTEVVNKDGDAAVLNHQHNPQYLGNESILVADSENNRVVELQKQQAEWVPVWSVSSAGGIPLDWPRDADRLPNGNTLITDSRNNRVLEIDPNGSLVWSISVPGLPYEADRLPHAEQATGVPTAQQTGGSQPVTETASATAPLPGFSLLYAGLTHVAPVPYWMSVWHVVVAVGGLLTAGCGLLLWRLSRARAERWGQRPSLRHILQMDVSRVHVVMGLIALSSVLVLGGVFLATGSDTAPDSESVRMTVLAADDPQQTGQITHATLAVDSARQSRLEDVRVVLKTEQGSRLTEMEVNQSVLYANQTTVVKATTPPRVGVRQAGAAVIEVRATNPTDGSTIVRQAPLRTTPGHPHIANPLLHQWNTTDTVPLFWKRHSWTNTAAERVDVTPVTNAARGQVGTRIRVGFDQSRETGPWTMGGIGQQLRVNETGVIVTVQSSIRTRPTPTPDTFSALTVAQNKTRLWFVFTPTVDQRTQFTQTRGNITYRIVYVPVVEGKPTDVLLDPGRHLQELDALPPRTCQRTPTGDVCGQYVSMRATVAGHPPFDEDAAAATFYRILPVPYASQSASATHDSVVGFSRPQHHGSVVPIGPVGTNR